MKNTMIETWLNHKEFVLTGITRKQAECQLPNDNNYGLLELADGAFAVYYKPNHITVWNEATKNAVTAALQKRYNEAIA